MMFDDDSIVLHSTPKFSIGTIRSRHPASESDVTLAQPNVYAPNDLHTRGFAILKTNIPIPRALLLELDAALANRKGVHVLFNNQAHDGARNDRRRRQASLFPDVIDAPQAQRGFEDRRPECVELQMRLNALLREHAVLWGRCVSDIVVLESRPGCKQQALHTDFDPRGVARLSREMIPLGAIFCLEDEGSRLIVQRLDDIHGNLEEVSVQKGELLVFRGDLKHAGASYNERNRRIHFYLDCEHHERPPNRTFISKDQGPVM
ncbi:hypothetical protein BC830DRAFT_1100088 [Chytriomyces sp. MP71]|nr:hypothetical protein BC830DRAFT_1100088 [Chytriomyces sp. MP71]